MEFIKLESRGGNYFVQDLMGKWLASEVEFAATGGVG